MAANPSEQAGGIRAITCYCLRGGEFHRKDSRMVWRAGWSIGAVPKVGQPPSRKGEYDLFSISVLLVS